MRTYRCMIDFSDEQHEFVIAGAIG